MSRSSAPSASANNSGDKLVNTNAYLPFKTLAMQRLSKILIDGAMTPERFRLEALHYLIYPKKLTHYRIHQYGWLATQSQTQIKLLDEAGKLAPLVEQINALEADTTIAPYERVGKIVEAIKTATGKRFIRNGAFRELMNAKFNEYTLAGRLNEIHSIDDALRILKDEAVQSKPMKVISTFPELFASTSIRSLLAHDSDAKFVFGGATDSTLPAAVTSFLRELTPERVASGATRRLLEELVLANVEPTSATHAKLSALAATLPAAPSGQEVSNTLAFLKFSFSNQLNSSDLFDKPSFVAAAESILNDAANADDDFRLWIEMHLSATYDTHAKDTGRVIADGTELFAIAQNLMAAIKDVPVQHADSFDSVLMNMSDTYAGPRERSRHAFVWAIDSILAVDAKLPINQFHRECAKILHGVPLSLFPSDNSLVPVAKSLKDRVGAAVSLRFNEQKVNEDTGAAVLGFITDTYIAGAPVISDFRTYQKSVEKPELTVTFGDDVDRDLAPPRPLALYQRPMSAPVALTQKVQRAREITFGANPRNPPPEFVSKALTIHALAPSALVHYPVEWKKHTSKVDSENAISLLGTALNLATRDTALHRALDLATAEKGAKMEPAQFAKVVASACRHGAVATSVDDVGNSVIHDVVASFGKLPTKKWEQAIIALTDQGAHFAGGNHFGVSLAEMLPNGIDEKIEKLALSTIAQHGVVSALLAPGEHALIGDEETPSPRLKRTDALAL